MYVYIYKTLNTLKPIPLNKHSLYDTFPKHHKTKTYYNKSYIILLKIKIKIFSKLKIKTITFPKKHNFFFKNLTNSTLTDNTNELLKILKK